MDDKNTNNQTGKTAQTKQTKQAKKSKQAKKTSQTDTNMDEFKKDLKTQMNNVGKTAKTFAIGAGTFSVALLLIICIILYVFISGGLALYLSKLGAANILPTNKDVFPYTNVEAAITPSSTNIFTNSKINFPYDAYNSSNYLLNGTRKFKETLQSRFYLVYLIMRYFITIYENMVQFNYTSINFMLYLINKISNDTVILLFGPTILTILTGIISMLNPFYFIFTWFASLKTFFEFEKNATQLEGNADFKGIWKSFNSILNLCIVPLSVIIALFMAWIMLLMFFFSTWWTFSVVSFILFLVLWSCYFYNAMINGERATLITTILGLLKFYKVSLMILISLIIIVLSFLNFGILGTVACIGILLLIYLGAFKQLNLDMFSPSG